MSTFHDAVEKIRLAMTDSVDFDVLRLAQAQHGPSRRVIWIPTTFTNTGVERTNPVYDGEVPRRSIGTDRLTVEAHIIGDNFDDVCALRYAVLNATRAALMTGSVPAGGEYVTQLENTAGSMFGGREKIIQRFVWSLPILEPLVPDASRLIEGIDQDSAIGDPENPANQEPPLAIDPEP